MLMALNQNCWKWLFLTQRLMIYPIFVFSHVSPFILSRMFNKETSGGHNFPVMWSHCHQTLQVTKSLTVTHSEATVCFQSTESWRLDGHRMDTELFCYLCPSLNFDLVKSVAVWWYRPEWSIANYQRHSFLITDWIFDMVIFKLHLFL